MAEAAWHQVIRRPNGTLGRHHRQDANGWYGRSNTLIGRGGSLLCGARGPERERRSGERPRGLDIGLPGANKALLERLVERGGLKGGAWRALVPLLLALLLLLAHRPLGFTARVAHEVDRPTPTRARARRGVDLADDRRAPSTRARRGALRGPGGLDWIEAGHRTRIRGRLGRALR